jgi:protein TonB
MGARADKAMQQLGEPLGGGGPRMSRWLAASVALHVSILGVLLYTRPPQFAPVALPGDRTGHLLSLTYWPGSSAPASTLQARTRPAVKAAHARAVVAPVPTSAPSAPSVASTSADAATGVDALGDGDTTLALVVVHPPPHPDLTQLPSGTRGDVIVDVVIDANGRIAKFTMTRGLGHGVDETVLAAIRQWTFQPATRNGIPVASEQELLFHYERG